MQKSYENFLHENFAKDQETLIGQLPSCLALFIKIH